MDRLLNTALLTALIFIVISVQIQHAQGQMLATTSLPAALFESNGGVHKIVQGSVIQLYCSVESNTAIFSWTKDGDPVVINVPHLHQRTCNDSNTTTSVLTIKGFQSGDNGTYQCLAKDGVDSGNGSVVTLTAFSSTADGSLNLTTEPISNEALFEGVYVADNRTGVVLGSTVNGSLLTCEAHRVGLGISIPTVLWTLNGKPITNNVMSNAFRSSLEIANFTVSEAGVYQCIFTDTDADSEIVTSTPFRLDTDIFTERFGRSLNTISLERISPAVVYLCPPEKLVIEVKAKGRFREVQWVINGTPITHIQSHVASFSNYKEVLFIEETTEANFGLYEFSARFFSPFQLLVPTELDIIVTSPVDAHTAANNRSVVSVIEGVHTSVTISCTSNGAPTPSIVWMLDGQPAPFIGTNSITNVDIAVTYDYQTRRFIYSTTLGSITSNLEIVNPRYPDHDGVYTCVGTNGYKMVNASSFDNITVQILVIPVVEIIVSHSTGINIGTTIMIYCNVSRTCPGIRTYRWIHNDTNTVLGSTNMLTLMLSRMQDFETYRCEATNAANLTESGNVIIEPGSIYENLMDITVLSPEAAILSCLASGEPLPEIVWIKGFVNGSVTNIDNFANITEIIDAPNKTSILTIEPTSAKDTASYNCRVQNRLYSLTSGKAKVTILIRTESFIQLRLFPVDSCVSWTEGNRDKKRVAIITSLLKVIQDTCNCDFNSENIAESLFSCRHSQIQVVFKAQVYYIYNSSQPEQYSTDNITRIVSVWVSSGPSLTVAGVVLSVDPSCPVQVESLTAEDCVQSLPSNEFSNDSSAIIWGPIIGALIIIIAILVTVILLFSCFQRRKSKSTSLSRPSSHELDLKSTVTLSNSAHQPVPEYEVIPAFREANNPVAEPNIAYGMIGPKSGQEN